MFVLDVEVGRWVLRIDPAERSKAAQAGPLAEAVVSAMVASYILSRTLVPTLVMLLMGGAHAAASASSSLLQRLYRRFDEQFERVRRAYTLTLSAMLEKRKAFALSFLGFCVLSCLLYPILGRDFFPSVDGGQIRLHMRLATGARIEETARVADEVEGVIRTIVPARDLAIVLEAHLGFGGQRAGSRGDPAGHSEGGLRSAHVYDPR